MTDPSPAWQRRLADLPPAQHAEADALRARFAALGADDPEGCARSEIAEDQPHLARYLLLRTLWRTVIDNCGRPTGLEQSPVGRRLLDAGADRADLARFAREVAYEALFLTLEELDGGGGQHAGQDAGPAVGWSLQETGADGALTGRRLAALHEDLLTMDPGESAARP
ncbi:hypothetical protein [Kitasatospora sp. LaBMicrA B282]|uniref:hypothetical protein n=1 Tax=Kitasatospora sp. LaBMicrA B282 TaxID=3420949 RepID=UPI003D0FFE94